MKDGYLQALSDITEKLEEYESLVSHLQDFDDDQYRMVQRVLTDVRRYLYDLEEDHTKSGNK